MVDDPDAASLPTIIQGVLTVLDSVGNARCAGTLLSEDLAVFMGCAVAFGDRVVASHAFDSDEWPRPPVRYTVTSALESNGVVLAELRFLDEYSSYPAAWSLRSPIHGEPATMVRVQRNGVELVAGFPIEASLFDAASAPPSLGTQVGIVFGSDAQFIGFCATDPECSVPRDCVSLRAIANLLPDSSRPPTDPALASKLRRFAAMAGVSWGDVDRDRRPDALVVNRRYTFVRRGTAGGLGANEAWCAACAGGALNALADVTGDGRADFIALGRRFGVLASTGSEFVELVTAPHDFSDAELARVGDVDGNGTPDVVVLDKHLRLWVVRDPATSTPSIEEWPAHIPSDWMSIGLAQVDDHSGADLIIGATDRVEVMSSMGDRFAEPQVWLRNVVAHPPGWFFADVTGDELVDAVRIDPTGSSVYPSDGIQFLRAAASWTRVPVGERFNRFFDIDGDGRADALVHDTVRTRVLLSTGSDFEAPRLLDPFSYFGGY